MNYRIIYSLVLPSFLPSEKSLNPSRNQQNKGEEKERST